MFGRGIVFFSENKSVSLGGNFVLTGGTETTVGSDKVLTFTTTSTLTVVGSGTVSILVVGGGQNGGAGDAIQPGFASGAGGKGGGVVYYGSWSVSPGSYTVTVGGINQNSSFSTITATAGAGANGGAARTIDGPGLSGTNGVSNSITGVSYTYASGGGSGAYWGSYNGGTPGTGGGTGGSTIFSEPQPGQTATNYGGGGGGAAFGYTTNYATSTPGNGRQGVVIFRYTPN